MKVIAVIPSLKERTADVAISLVRKQISDVIVLENLERAESIATAWDISKEYDYLVWTPTDLLIKRGVIDGLLQELIKSKTDRIVGRCMSKFRGMTVGGVTIQKTHKNEQLIKHLRANPNSLRPESGTALQLLTHVKSNIDAGFHEYFLDYDEIYARYQHHRKKHERQVLRMVQEWRIKAKTDKDFRAAMHGVLGLPQDMESKGVLSLAEVKQIIKMV